MNSAWWQRLALWMCTGLLACTSEGRVIPVDCNAVHRGASGPVCDLDFEAGPVTLGLILTVESGAQVHVLRGATKIPGRDIILDQGVRSVSLSPHRGASSLWILVTRSPLSVSLHRIPLGEVHHPAWLREARRLWITDHQQDAADLLVKRLAQPQDAESHAIALSYLGRIHKEQGLFAPARTEMTQSLRELRATGQISVAFTNAMDLATLYRDQNHRPRDAQRLLDDLNDLVPLHPTMAPWMDLHRAWNLQAEGDLRGALRFLDRGLREARHFGAEMVHTNLLQVRAEILYTLGRTREAAADLEEAKRWQPSPCWQAQMLAREGHGLVMARDAALPGDQTADPRAPLSQALTLSANLCKKADLQSSIVIDLARAEVQDGGYDKARRWLEQARAAAASDGSQPLHQAILELDGEIALGRGDAAAARGFFEQLHQSATLPDERETPWRALLGLARAHEGSDPAQALDLYQQAEAYLDKRSQSLPLGAGRGSFLGQHERGTSFHIDLLARQNDAAQAMRVIRSARIRGLQALAALDHADALAGSALLEWQAGVASYRRQRLLVKAASEALRNAPRQELTDRSEALRGASEDALREMEGALQALVPVSAEPLALPPLTPGEGLLTCHPQRQGYLCVFMDQEGVQMTPVARLGPQVPAAELGQALLQPFAPRLRRLQRLRVLSLGALRQVDVHRLPFDGHPLEELPKLEVVYALDLPIHAPARAAAPAAQRAVLLFDPTGQIPRPLLEAQRQAATAALSQRGYQVDTFFGAGDSWRQALAEAPQLLLYLGHSTTGAGWQQRIGSVEDSGLMISDLLMDLPHSARVAVIATCAGGLSGEETGGVEGLSLGTAFLLRGDTQVAIAPIREVSAQVAAAVIVALSEEGPSAVLAAPGQSLRRALAKVRADREAHHASVAAAEEELDAFRVFVR